MATSSPGRDDGVSAAATRRPWSRWAVAVAVAAASAALAGLVVVSYTAIWPDVMAFCHAIDLGDRLFIDFADYYYATGERLLVWPKPVQGFYYSMFFGMLMSPLALLGLEAATRVWLAVQAATLALLVVVPGVPFWRRSPRYYVIYLVLVLCSLPLVHCFKWGQISTTLVLCVLVAMCLYQRGSRVLAGVMVALPAAIKLYPGVIAFYFLIKRDWRALGAFAAALATFLVVIPALQFGLGETIHFHRMVYWDVQFAQLIALRADGSQYLPYIVFRFIRGMPHMYSEVNFLRGLSVSLFAINLLALNRFIKKRPADQTLWTFAMLLLSLPLVVETSWPHYFGYLPFCQVVACMGIDQDRSGPRRLAQMALLWLPSVVLSSTGLFIWVHNWHLYYWYGCLFFSNALLLVVVYLHLWSTRAPRAPLAAPQDAREGRATPAEAAVAAAPEA